MAHTVVALKRHRWPKGTFMKLKSTQLLEAFVGPEEHKKMSARKLARYAGISPAFVDHLKSGRRNSCTPQVAERISEALEVPVGVLFDPTEPPSKRQIEAHERARRSRADRTTTAA